MKKGIFKFNFEEQRVSTYFYPDRVVDFDTFDKFLEFNYGSDGINFFTSFSELGAIYNYIKYEGADKYVVKKITISPFINKVIGVSVYRKDKFSYDNKNKIKYYPFKTFYDMKYKIGTDELNINEALDIIEHTDFSKYNSGYTSKLRKEIKYDNETLIKIMIEKPCSMAPVIFSKWDKEEINVKCFDIVSAYPYLLTQPLPHYDKSIPFNGDESIFNESDKTYWGGIKIYGLAAKNSPYFPLTLVGKNKKGIEFASQGKNILNMGVRIISAGEVTLYGFLPHLLEVLKENYTYRSYEITKNILRFNLKIDEQLRNIILKYFERKQTKKRNGQPYGGEKVLLNRIYGFFLTVGNNTPAHYGQYVVSKQRLIMDRMVRKIGIEDAFQSHTDSLKFVGEHEDIIEEYNKSIEFPELGKFKNEGIMQKCVYYSYITAKYIDENGKLGFKHGGIDAIGITHLYKKKYEEITKDTKYLLCTGYFYCRGEGYYFDYAITSFRKSISKIYEGDKNGS